MATYIYSCKECNFMFERQLPINEDNDKHECPCCKKDANKIVSTKANFILKGTGWPGKDIKEGR